ncbi:hypothetical protein [Paraburkholderia kirstenboschensis]|uniref:Uncharacterized protein n=1 Tax=Paraburkholderia kirstenboschensis TaxID=1245436 RepID=A0ABZ0EE10_9BURK|nr:hypothetical protein [Paraburkholderia kirstenboschensis]WOD14780.1 hypothetical protein RW095_04145 [Paraburkholderia kirstenboschensis]
MSYFGAAATVAATINGVPGSNLGTAPSLSGFASASTHQSIAAGGAYQFGPARAGITGTNTAFKGLGDTSSGPTRSASPAARITTTPKSTASTT